MLFRSSSSALKLSVVQLILVTGIKPTVLLSAIDKENLIRVLAALCLTYIQDYLFTNVCSCV